MTSSPINMWRILGFSICVLYFFYCATHLSTWHIIDGVNLLMHEAGHAIFSPLGEFLHILGGSLFQIIIPCIFAYYFWERMQIVETSVMMLWLGQSIINVSVYIGDAIAMQLPLLGGDTTMHDWHNLLSMMHVLPFAAAISHTVYAFGLIIMIGSICWVAWKEIIQKI